MGVVVKERHDCENLSSVETAGVVRCGY